MSFRRQGIIFKGGTHSTRNGKRKVVSTRAR